MFAVRALEKVKVPFIVNWFVAFKETEKPAWYGYLGTVDQRSHFLIVRSGALEPWSPNPKRQGQKKDPI